MMLIGLVISIGGQLLQKLFAPKPKDIYGPRLSDVNVPAVSPGNPIVRHWGTMKLQGFIIWTSRLIETEHDQPVGGGKGALLGGSDQKQITYTYSVHLAILICQGPVTQINRIWANGKMLWLNPALAADAQNTFDTAYYAELNRLINDAGVVDLDYAYAGAFFFAFNNYRPDEFTYGTQQEATDYIIAHPGVPPFVDPGILPANPTDIGNVLGQMLSGLGHDEQYANNKVRYDAIEIYTGQEEQLPDPLVESYLGAGNVPGYRGIAYFVMNNLQLEDFGNAIPTMTIEVQKLPGDQKLQTVIGDICAESGLLKGEYDSVSRIPKDQVCSGYAITQTTNGRDAITNLMKVFPFDGAETGYKLLFQWINARPRAILRREDFGAHLDTDDYPVSEQVTRIHDFDLPKRLNLKYQEPARAYSANQTFAVRDITDATMVEDTDVTIALTRDNAKTCVENMLALKFTARQSYKMFLPRKYAILECGDPVLCPDKFYPGKYYTLRLVEMNIGVNGICEATFATHNFYFDMAAQAGIDLNTDSDTNQSQIAPPTGSPTQGYLIDCPLLTDTEDDTIGFYAVLGGTRNDWRGGVLLVDLAQGGTVEAYGGSTTVETSGSNWYVVASNKAKGLTGYAVVPPASAHPCKWDYQNKVKVLLRTPTATIISRSKIDVITQALNVVLVGDEIIQFCNATDRGNGLWELDTLLRGQRGTEAAINTHVAGERFVSLSRDVVNRITHRQDYLGKTAPFKALTMGDTTDLAQNLTFADTGNSLRPRAVHLIAQRCYRDDAHNLNLSWLPRARQNGNLISGRPVLLDQATEAYQIDFRAGSTLYTVATNDRTYTLAAADQSTQGLDTTQPLTVTLYQIGAIIGRGYPRTITL